MSNTPTEQVLSDIAAERQSQLEVHDWTHEHDDEHDRGELALAAACYATPILLYKQDDFANAVHFVDPWPWDGQYDRRLYHGNSVEPNKKLHTNERRRQLVKAAALIVAEIERLDRKGKKP